MVSGMERNVKWVRKNGIRQVPFFLYKDDKGDQVLAGALGETKIKTIVATGKTDGKGKMTSHDYGKIESILTRADTYKVAYRRMSFVALALAATTVISTAAAVALALSKPAPVYFATNSDGSITPIIPVSQPHLSPAEVANFATEAATRSLTYSFSNYRAEFEDMKPYFSKPRGWNSFVDAVNKAVSSNWSKSAP
ncbi:hypothetical protein DEA98_29155 (plasmid) [Brucella pseudogrignonensis]|nr:hypothetical protein [Brucella pseudogrignonensis]